MSDDEVRYGLIGAGMMGIEHARNPGAIEGARITALADTVDNAFVIVDHEHGGRAMLDLCMFAETRRNCR
ncbi:MAG: hypothetical protein ACYCZM_12440 [Acidimicrobiales bacterium]